MTDARAALESAVPADGAAPGLAARLGRLFLLAVVPLSMYWLPLGRLPGLGNVTAADAALLGLWALTAIALLVRPRARIEPAAPIIVALALAIAVLAGVGARLSPSEGNGSLEFMLFMKRFGLAAILPVAASLFRGRRMGTWMRVLTAGTAVYLAVFTLFPGLQEGLPRPELWEAEAMGERATGPLTNPNDLAYAAVALAILHAASLPHRRRAHDVPLLAVAFAASATCLVSSASRSGVLGALAALGFVLLSSRVRLRSKVLLVATITVAIASGLSYSRVFEDRLASAYRQGLREGNVGSRLDAQALAMRMSLAHPLGVGYAGFARATAHDRTYFTLETSDSVYLDTLLGAGFLGLACLLGIFAAAWWHVGRRAAGSGGRSRALRAGLVAFLVFGSATVVPISVFLAPLFFSIVAAAAYPDPDAGAG